MARNSQRAPFRSITLLATSTLGVVIGCWTGEDSRGLPCESSVECGLGLDCVNGYCGGVAAEGLCGNGWVDPGEACDEAEQNAAAGHCRPDCTLELCGDGVVGPSEQCDAGEQNADTGACKTDCTPATCGDGFIGPTEVCDDGNTDPSDGCSPTCTLESCGNGIVDPGEDCDEQGESATCDDDCTPVACGDQNINQAAGEGCDNDSPAVDDPQCMSNCTVPLLWDDLEPDSPMLGWSFDEVSMTVPNTWMVTTRNAQGMRSWDSGLPAGMAGDTRLITPPVDLSGLTGQTIQLRFDHARELLDCNEPLVAYEGGVIEVSVDNGPFEIVTPDDGYSGPIGEPPACDNPLAGQLGFTLAGEYATETVDLSSYAGSVIEVGFRVAWDCGNCPIDQTGRGWFIDNVIVSIL
jgi:cysteine-rich repeat protein